MTNLSPEDQAASDAVIAEVIAACEAAGVTDQAMIESMAADILVAELHRRRDSGDAQATRILDHWAVDGVAAWIAEEEAAGRPCHDVESTVHRLKTSASQRKPHPA